MGFERGLLATVCVALNFASVSTAFAQATTSDSASAEALFEAGKAALDEGKVADACPKFEESLKLDDAIGTRFQLARCYEALGRTASAWTLYLDVAAKAKASGQSDREGYARAEAARLKPSLSKLTIIVPVAARAAGLEVTRNGVAVGSGQWELALPVDPGEVRIIAKAPGKKERVVNVTVGAHGDAVTFNLQPLDDAPRAETLPGGAAAKEPAKKSLSQLQWVGLGMGGLGVVGLGIAGAFGVIAKNRDSASGCHDGNCPDSTALSRNAEARSAGNVATVAVVAGGVLVATGVTLFLVGPTHSDADRTPKPTARLEPLLGVGFAGASLGGSF